MKHIAEPSAIDPITKELLDEHQLTLLKFGAAGERSLDGKLTELPAESAPELEAARPKNGAVDSENELAREEAIVKRLVKHAKTAVLVLGGAHDLTEIIRKHDGWGYVRVKPKEYPDRYDRIPQSAMKWRVKLLVDALPEGSPDCRCSFDC